MLALFKLLIILILTIALLIRKLDLGLTLLIDIVILKFFFGISWALWSRAVLRGICAGETLVLISAVALVLILAELLRRTGALEQMVSALENLIPDSRVVLAVLPALVGMLPMIGGAMFSAPLVDGVGVRLGLSAEHKTFINYWFRHIMEYVFPLYSSLLLIVALSDVSLGSLIAAQFPLSLAAIIGGIIWGLRGISPDRARKAREMSRKGAGRALLASLWSILTTVALVILWSAAAGRGIIPKTMEKWGMPLSVGLVLIIFGSVNRITPRQWCAAARSGLPLKTFSALWGVMIFKSVIEQSDAVEQIPAALNQLGLPAVLVIFAIPFLAGLLTGAAPAAIGLGYPIVMPLVQYTALSPLTSAMWIFVAAFTGVLLSPLHLCLALTREYYNASWGGLYRRIAPSVGLLWLMGIALLLLHS